MRANAHNRLVNAILGINLDRTLRELAVHDPLSWHCTARGSQQTWLMHQKRETENGTMLPHPERPQSPRTKRPEYQDEDSDCVYCTWCSMRGDPCRSQSIHYHGHRFGGSTPQSTIRRTWTCCHRHPEQHWAHTSRSFHPCDSMLSEVHTVR